ncbi:MAG TPA: BatB protein [Halieaceae bacterium]|nr:BatB protein [Halieaceae bacterium]
MLEWLWPWMFALIPLPLVGLLRRARSQRSSQNAIWVPQFQQWQSVAASRTTAQTHLSSPRYWLLFLIWCALVAGIARPQWIGEPILLPQSGRDLLLAVDISGSMRVEDMIVNQQVIRRIDAVRQIGAEFIERREGDRVGLILFGSRAYMQSPLSFDRDTVQQFLLEAQIGFAGSETAIGDALGLAVKRLREKSSGDRVVILLTDGQDTASSVAPLDATALAANYNVKVYTIGIGADEMLVPSLFGSRRVNPSAELDESTLTAMAESTGGRYFRARSPQELATIYDLLDELEPAQTEGATFRPQQSLLHWPIGLAGALTLLWLALQRRRLIGGGNHAELP